MSWIACYDIGDEELRNRIVARLLAFGFQRLQRSVFLYFEDDISEAIEILQKMKSGLKEEDSVVLVPLCKHCFGRIAWISGRQLAPPEAFKII